MAKPDPAFDHGIEQPVPNAYVQWKGTDVCMDFHCECGQDDHIDAMFVYNVKCHHCGMVWEMPSRLYPRRAADQNPDGLVYVTQPHKE